MNRYILALLILLIYVSNCFSWGIWIREANDYDNSVTAIDGYVLTWDSSTEKWYPAELVTSSTYLDLTDTPSSYSGQAGKYVRVNAGETGLEFNSPSGTGTMTTVKEGGTAVGDPDIVSLDFQDGFDITEPVDQAIQIDLDLSEVSGYNNTNWDTAYGWGDHSTQGYITASSTDTLTNKSGNISMWTNDSGYLTSLPSLTDGYIWIGNSSNVATEQIMSGDVTITNAGVTTVVDDSHNHVITNIDSFTESELETQLSNVTNVYTNNDGDLDIVCPNIMIDGGGSTITTGVKAIVRVEFDCVIKKVSLISQQSGSIKVDIWKDTFANVPLTDSDTITGSNEPEIVSGYTDEDSTLTGWTTSITAGDVLVVNVDSVSTFTLVTLVLKLEKN